MRHGDIRAALRVRVLEVPRARGETIATHLIELERRTLHGHFSRDLPPIASVAPGDTVRCRTLDGGWGLEPPRLDGSARRCFEPRDPELDSGHALIGPFEIRGAKPGMTLEVKISVVEPGAWGWTRAGGWPTALNQRLGVADGDQHLLVWTLDAAGGSGRDQFGRSVRLGPFLGVIGMPPDQPGIHSTIPPRAWGGNMDCKELVAGSRLLLPIASPGARVSFGDGHAAQGDGEVSQLAIECPMERVELTFDLKDDPPLTTPIAETSAAWITFGFHESLDEAAAIALDAMLDLMGRRLGLTRKDALALASVVVDLRVTQMVNRARGVHARLTHDAIR